MNASNSPYSVELTDYLMVLRRRWRVVLVLTCCGLLVSAVVVAVAAREYTATASVYVTELAGADYHAVKGLHSPVNMDNEANLAQSQTVAEIASRRLRPPIAPSLLRGRVSVAVPPNSTVLNIRCQASTADRAAACANAIATAYLSVRLTIATDAGRRPATAPAGHIITRATSPSSPSSPRSFLILVSGLLGGVILGLLVAFLKDHVDERLRTRRDVERALDLPVLWSAPDGGGSIAELAGFAAAGLGEEGQVIAAASVASEPGRVSRLVATALATALADVDSEVVLAASDGPGLAELLTGRAALHEVVRPAGDVSGLRVVGAGPAASGESAGLNPDGARHVLAELRANARYVVLETELAQGSPESYTFAALAEAVILVVQTDHTQRHEAIECLERLDRLGCTVLCAVMVAPSAEADSSASAIALHGITPGQQTAAVATDRPQS
jgi:capsular polysaccharide biosynthesis protein